MKKTTYLPRARIDGLVVKELTDEVLVYDLHCDKAHCLNLTAAAVWKQCDGRSTATQIARRLSRREAGLDAALINIDEQVVWLALEQLSRGHLLEEHALWSASIPRMSRREAIRGIGIGAAIALPVVVSITAPLPAQAGTCRARGQTCGTSSQCCSQACIGGTCA